MGRSFVEADCANSSLLLHLSCDQTGYFPGQTVRATVSVLARRAVQLDQLVAHCAGHERLDLQWVTPHPGGREEAGLARGERRTFRTRATPLLSGCELQAGERRTVHLSFRLPARAQPSHRGAFARTWTQLSASLRARGCEPSTAALPLRVWPPPPGGEGAGVGAGEEAEEEAEAEVDVEAWEEGGGEEAAPPATPALGASDALSPLFGTPTPAPAPAQPLSPHAATPRSPAASLFAGGPYRRQASLAPSPLALAEEGAAGGGGAAPAGGAAAAADEAAAAGEADGRLRRYAVRCGAQPLLQVALRSGPAVRCGEALEGTITFEPPPAAAAGGARLLVASVAVALESEERVAAGRAARRAAVAEGAAPSRRTLHDECWEATADLGRSYFCFSLAPDASPSFSGRASELTWCLQFEFTLERAAAAEGQRGGSPAPPAAPAPAAAAEEPQTLRWALPLTVLPPSGAD